VDAGPIFEAADEAALGRYGVSALAIAGDGEARGYGVPAATTFRVASITKPIVAATAMRLVEEGRLALDEPLSGLRLPWDGITLRHLLSHQAGLATGWPEPLEEYGEGEDALERLAEATAVGGPVGPGRLFTYANPGYWLTGALIQRAAGVPFEDAVRQLVLAPLGMERTGFLPSEPSVPSSLPYPRARRPAGGLYSCVGDLMRFARHLLGGPGPLTAGSLRELQTPQIAVGPDGDYGLGLGVVRARGPLTVEHGGAVPGVRTQLLVVPEDDAAFVLLTDSDRGLFLINRLLGAVGLALHLPPEAAVAEEVLAALAGTFREPLGTTIQVAPREGGIDVGSVHLRPASPTRFVVRDGDEKGDWAEFFEGGRLMRYDALYERVPA
jgi:CubicO group peptidase (beta-lactamase class C family)